MSARFCYAPTGLVWKQGLPQVAAQKSISTASSLLCAGNCYQHTLLTRIDGSAFNSLLHLLAARGLEEHLQNICENHLTDFLGLCLFPLNI